MPFNDQEKERIRYHQGYLNVSPAAGLQFGLPAPTQMLFILESAMDKILPEAEDRVRRIVSILDKIECQMEDGTDYLVATNMDDISIRPDHTDALEREYTRWAKRLSDILGSPINYYSDRFKTLQGARVQMIPRK